MAQSDRYEFDAPSHVVNFHELAPEEEDGDAWFENPSEELATPLRCVRSGKPEAIVNPLVRTDTAAAAAAVPTPPSNIVTSWAGARQAGAEPRAQRRSAALSPAEPRRVSKRKMVSSGPAAPPSKKQKPPNTSEDQELERIRSLQREVALHRRRNEASFKAALAGNPPPKKLALSTTVPKEFHFNTDTRVKASASSTDPHSDLDFAAQLRKPSSPAKARRGATVPKPFQLSRGSKKAAAAAAYVSVAQQIEQFEKRTPARYHVRSRRSQDKGPSAVKREQLKLTKPQTPSLQTRQRTRATAVKSSQEREAEQLEELHKFHIKPVELNMNILRSAETLKKPAVKEPTVPEGFELEIEKRLQSRQSSRKLPEGEERAYNFRARPPPRELLEGVVGLPEKKVLLPTVPESPHFTLTKRVRPDHRPQEMKPPSPVKPPPVPHLGLPFQPRLPEHRQVEVCPFSFEERERERRALKEKKLEEQRNDQAPSFKAQPLPDFEVVTLPKKKKLEATKPLPFRLLLEERGAVKSSRWESMVKEEQKQQEEAAAFRANPNTVVHKEPFRPKKEERPAVAPEGFELATERRAREWQDYERLASEKEAVRARMEEERRREEETAQREEVARLRQEQVHRAQPIRHYKGVSVKKSELPLTVPESPNFSDRFRL